MQQFNPLEDRVLVVPIKSAESEKTDGGLYIPNTAQRPVVKATVVAVGPGIYARDTGEIIPTFLSKSDTVLCAANDNKPAGIEIEISTENGKEFAYILRESDVLMLLPKKTSS